MEHSRLLGNGSIPGRAKSQDKSQFIGRIRAAELSDVSPQTIDKFIRTGRLRAFRIGRRVVVRQDELLRLVEANEIQ
jgi:excisionase family DNA binding protein